MYSHEADVRIAAFAEEAISLSSQVRLGNTGLTVSRVGYGTSMLMSRLNRRQSMRLVNAALDAGITHFDTARLYGYGEAESVLGEALHGRRDQVTITTKAGILPPGRSLALSLARQVGRRLVSCYPGLRKRLANFRHSSSYVNLMTTAAQLPQESVRHRKEAEIYCGSPKNVTGFFACAIYIETIDINSADNVAIGLEARRADPAKRNPHAANERRLSFIPGRAIVSIRRALWMPFDVCGSYSCQHCLPPANGVNTPRDKPV